MMLPIFVFKEVRITGDVCMRERGRSKRGRKIFFPILCSGEPGFPAEAQGVEKGFLFFVD
jgi:hypothetical protein